MELYKALFMDEKLLKTSVNELQTMKGLYISSRTCMTLSTKLTTARNKVQSMWFGPSSFVPSPYKLRKKE